jgi:uncharacterized DUF497 family protein
VLVVIHTFAKLGSNWLAARLISARRATLRDRRTQKNRKDKYDLSKAERGRFFREGAKLHLPVYLDDEIQSYFEERARAKGVDVDTMVNDLLKREAPR